LWKSDAILVCNEVIGFYWLELTSSQPFCTSQAIHGESSLSFALMLLVASLFGLILRLLTRQQKPIPHIL
jgi:uncharacterized membrane protein